jgi:very-short-patch-repair endonuclease
MSCFPLFTIPKTRQAAMFDKKSEKERVEREMAMTNILYCFEDRKQQRCWVGFWVMGSINIDAAERFVKVLASYSEAGLRQIQVIGCKQRVPTGGQNKEDIKIYEEQRLYTDPCQDKVSSLAKYLGKVRIEELNEVGRWDIFIPAMIYKPGDGGTADVPRHSGYRRGSRQKPRTTIQQHVIDRILDAFAELSGEERRTLDCRWTEFLTSNQRGYVLKYGDLAFPVAQPTESPIEDIFWKRAQHEIPGLVPQYEIAPYRVDFALPEQQLVIELDGYRYHTPVEHRLNDVRRERDLQAQGWRVIRFLGTEIHQDLDACITQIKQIAGLEEHTTSEK